MFAGLFLPLGQLESNHGIPCALVEFGQLSRRVARRLCLSDAGLDLSPISHAREL
jgi:hypothetical protein